MEGEGGDRGGGRVWRVREGMEGREGEGGDGGEGMDTPPSLLTHLPLYTPLSRDGGGGRGWRGRDGEGREGMGGPHITKGLAWPLITKRVNDYQERPHYSRCHTANMVTCIHVLIDTPNKCKLTCPLPNLT